MDLVKAEVGTTCDVCYAPATVCDLDAPCDRGFYCKEHDPRSSKGRGDSVTPEINKEGVFKWQTSAR
jgi:hypothetical protein